MQIQGRYEEYTVKWEPSGWSYAETIVRVRRPFLFRFSRLKKVWVGPHTSLIHAQKMHPDEMRKWFEKAVREYEDYVDAWGLIKTNRKQLTE